MPHTEETKSKMKCRTGEKSNNWKGDKIGYKGLHIWIEKQHGKAKEHICSMCSGKSGSTRMEWANITGIYNRDLKNWKPLCRKCHVKYDVENLGMKIGRPKQDRQLLTDKLSKL